MQVTCGIRLPTVEGASYLWNPATNCGRSVISIFLAIVVPISPPAYTHAAICVITSTLGAKWPSVAAIPPVTPIYNKTSNVVYHRNHDLTFCSPVVTKRTTNFNTKNVCILPTQCIYVFCMILTINSDHFHKQH